MKITGWMSKVFRRFRSLLPDRHWLAVAGLLTVLSAVIADGIAEASNV